jgi:hypothetical protein
VSARALCECALVAQPTHLREALRAMRTQVGGVRDSLVAFLADGLGGWLRVRRIAFEKRPNPSSRQEIVSLPSLFFSAWLRACEYNRWTARHRMSLPSCAVWCATRTRSGDSSWSRYRAVLRPLLAALRPLLQTTCSKCCHWCVCRAVPLGDGAMGVAVASPHPAPAAER